MNSIGSNAQVLLEFAANIIPYNSVFLTTAFGLYFTVGNVRIAM